MASPSSLTEPVKMRSTATTTLWELVSPICSCRLASLLESRPPLAITNKYITWWNSVQVNTLSVSNPNFKFCQRSLELNSTVKRIFKANKTEIDLTYLKKHHYWFHEQNFIKPEVKIKPPTNHFETPLTNSSTWWEEIIFNWIWQVLPSGSNASKGWPAFCISLSLWWPLFDLGLTPVPISWASSNCEMHLAIYGNKRAF